MARLDLDRSRSLFEHLASSYPDSREAQEGLTIARLWQPLLASCEGQPDRDAASAIWRQLRLRKESDRLLPARLRQALIRHLVSLLRKAALVFLPPDLARGALLLRLGRLQDAAADLRAAHGSHPDEPAVLVPLAEAEWRIGHCARARAVWARLLLAAPEAPLGPSAPADLRTVVDRNGAAWAPHFGWLTGVLPLVEAPESSAQTGPVRAYALLREAEAARHRQDFEAAVAARVRLRELAPEVLDAYLARLDRASG